MRLGIFARTFAGTQPARVLAQAAGAGYACVQYNLSCSGLSPMPDTIPVAAARAVAAAARETGVEIAAVSGTYNMIHPDPAVREAGHARLEALAGACRAMTAPLITLCTGTRDAHDQWRRHPDNDSADAWRDLLHSMERAVATAEKHGVDLGVEPELANVVTSARRARQLIDELATPRVKIVLDPANLFEVASAEERRELIAEAVDLLADRIVMAHAKDRTALGDFATCGEGVIDFPHFVDRLRSIGFNGPLVTHGLAPAEAPRVASFLRELIEDPGAAAA